MKKLALTVLAAMGAACTQAGAVTYTFTPTAIGPTSSPYYTLDTAAFTLSVDDATVRLGSFTYDYRYRYVTIGSSSQIYYVPSAVGDVQALQLFQTDLGKIAFTSGQGPRGTSSDYFSVSLQFTPAGEVSAGRVLYGDDAFGLDVSGTSRIFSGTFLTGFQRPDGVTGAVAGALSDPISVSEPGELGVLAIALGSLAVSRRRVFRGRARIEAA